MLAGDAEAGEEYVAGDPYTESMIIINVPKLYTLRAKVPRSTDRRGFGGGAGAGLVVTRSWTARRAAWKERSRKIWVRQLPSAAALAVVLHGRT